MEAPPVTLRPATEQDLAWVEAAVRTCPVTMVEIGGFYAQASTRLAPLLGPRRRLWLVCRGDDRVGFVDADEEVEGELGLAYFVVPAARRAGVGRRALGLVAGLRTDATLVAAISVGNEASLALARAAGFAEQSTHDGEVVMVRRPRPLG